MKPCPMVLLRSTDEPQTVCEERRARNVPNGKGDGYLETTINPGLIPLGSALQLSGCRKPLGHAGQHRYE